MIYCCLWGPLLNLHQFASESVLKYLPELERVSSTAESCDSVDFHNLRGILLLIPLHA